MPMHDWTRVDAGIWHAFHQAWILEIHRVLLAKLPAEYYSLPEQIAGDYGPDVLTLKRDDAINETLGGTTTLTQPQTAFYQETASNFYLNKAKGIAIRHVSGDRIVAVIELVSPGNRRSRAAFQDLLRKTLDLVQHKIHLLMIDSFPASTRDPHGLHARIFEEFQDDPLPLPADKPLCTFAYECADCVRAYVEPLAVGDSLPDMPVFLYPGMYILVPLEQTYLSAWATIPTRWQDVIAPKTSN